VVQQETAVMNSTKSIPTDLPSICSSVFMGDNREYEGPYYRELASRHPAKHLDIGAVFADIRASPRYRRFLNDRIAGCAVNGLDTELVDAVVADSVARVDPHTEESLIHAVLVARVKKVATLCGMDLTPDQVDEVTRRVAVDDGIAVIREAIEGLTPQQGGLAVAEIDGDTSPTPLAVAVPVPAEPVIDTEWLERFERAYGRDALVHEYILLRNLEDSDPETLYPLHVAAFERFEDMHRCYLNEHLCEADFVKRFVPAALLDDTLVDAERDLILMSAEYKDNMCTRLDAIHRTLYGEPLLEADALFERRVRDARLTLQSSQLNDLVVEFAREGELLASQIANIYVDCLKREPDAWEVSSRLPEFRTDADTATRALKNSLVSSLEFQDVLKDEIRRQAPQLTNARLFRVLEVALQADLRRVPTSDAVTAALAAV